MNATPTTAANPKAQDWRGELLRNGHTFLRATALQPLLEAQGSLGDWYAFAASWGDMPHDTYMADGGRYRRRRHAVFVVTADGRIERQPHQPHYQSRDYNTLNGGVERWFEPMQASIGASSSLNAILRFCGEVFSALAPKVARWHVETHQFRIEALSDMQGLPTPEGMHRDGVDYVLVLLVRRHNIASGTTTIHAPDGSSLGSFTLTHPFDATLIDDSRVFHGVTAVEPLDATQPAHRDVLVVTFRRQ
ncbi:MAG: 2OG-Fe dioxygenase family protein [Pseudomonadota bacterium]